MSKKDKENVYTLTAELQNYEQQGISIWLEGRLSDSDRITNAVSVHEEITYMRDYVFQDDELSEIHFDRITNS